MARTASTHRSSRRSTLANAPLDEPVGSLDRQRTDRPPVAGRSPSAGRAGEPVAAAGHTADGAHSFPDDPAETDRSGCGHSVGETTRRRTRCGGVRTEHTAIAALRTQLSAARVALVDDQAGVCRNDFLRLVLTEWTPNRAPQLQACSNPPAGALVIQRPTRGGRRIVCSSCTASRGAPCGGCASVARSCTNCPTSAHGYTTTGGYGTNRIGRPGPVSRG